MPEALIIGGGHNGLAAAFYLAKAGLRPLVLERRPEVGGGAITSDLHPGFRCPALTHDTMLHAGIVRDMALERHGVEPIAAGGVVFAPAPDGPPVVLYDDVERTAGWLARIHGGDAAAYGGFREALSRTAALVGATCELEPPDLDRPRAADLWELLKIGRRFRALGRRDGYRLLRWAPMAVADFVQEWFASDRVCAAVAAPGLSGTMLGPRSAGSTLVLLLREAHRQLAGPGGSQVRGGPGALTRAMAAAAAAAGADIRTDTSVERILTRDGRVTGVLAEGREIEAPIVLSGADPKSTFLRLIDPLELEPGFLWRIGHYRASGTLAKVNLALSALPAFHGQPEDRSVLAGRIQIGAGLDDLERAFDAAKYGAVPERPWLELTIPSLLDPGLAPPGAHVGSIYVHHVPFRLRDGSWAEARDRLLASVLRRLESCAPGIGATVLAAQVVTPADLERDYGFWGGHIFHGELALDQLFTMRPLLGHARYETPIAGLYLCGAGTHPGGFMSGLNGRLAAAAALRQQGRR